MSAITFDYNSNQIQELNSHETDVVSGGAEPVSTLTVGAIIALGAGGLVVGAAVAVAIWYFSD